MRDWLFNPFHFVAGVRALALGLIAIVLGAVLCVLADCHFDGVIDAHYGPTPSLTLAVGEGLFAFVIMAVTLTPFAYAIGRPGLRLIDLFGTQALARAPFVLVALIMLAGGALGLPELFAQMASQQQPQPREMAIVLLFGSATLLPVAWSIYLMYRSFAICTHANRTRTIICFVAALICAEIASKVVLWLVLR